MVTPNRIAITVTLLAGLLGATATSQAAAQRCGHISIGNGIKAKVRVVHGDVLCGKARVLIKSAYHAEATRHWDGTGNYGVYWRVRGFKCSIGLGGSETFCHQRDRQVDGSTRTDDGWYFSPDTAKAASRAEAPILGAKGAFQNGKGFGKVKPRVVYLGGDPTGYVSSLRWRHWGRSRAVGYGRGWCPGRSVAAGHYCRAALRVSSLGTCQGRPAYRTIAFYFKQHRHWLAGSKWNACTGASRASTAQGSAPGRRSSHRRYPVIGCDDLRSSGLNRYSWRYAPEGYCETSGSLGSTEGIDHARWRDWGRAKAHARGDLVDGLGFMYRARITAYGLYHCHNCYGISGFDPSWYRWLHVVSRGGSRGGAERGPFNVTINVTPQE